MFRYSFARALQQKFYPNYSIDINCYYFSHAGEEAKLPYLKNYLPDFCINNVTYSEVRPYKLKNFTQLCVAVVNRCILKKIRNIRPDFNTKFLQPFYNFFGIYTPSGFSVYVEPRFSRSRNIFCNSFFEHAGYFDGIRNILLEDFTPRHDVLPCNTDMIREIQTSESVCVTIRRGDFLNLAHFNVCNEEYFITAMKAMREELPDCKFFVFSDDVDDVKKNMHFPFDVTYERGDAPVWEKLRLMYSCKHFIISNSTFSWWAQYLSRNPNKIVYAPTPWHWSGEKWEGLYLPYMRTIECHKN